MPAAPCVHLQVAYDPKEVSYEALLDLFFDRVDPTTRDRQGNDSGSQYRSGIYYHSAEQKAAVEKVGHLSFVSCLSVDCFRRAPAPAVVCVMSLGASRLRATFPVCVPSVVGNGGISVRTMCAFVQAVASVNEKLQSNTWKRVLGSKVVTEVTEAGDYWVAESYHQVFLFTFFAPAASVCSPRIFRN